MISFSIRFLYYLITFNISSNVHLVSINSVIFAAIAIIIVMVKGEFYGYCRGIL